ncbi:MAG: hypothetical protein ACOC4H_03565 [bacterium]
MSFEFWVLSYGNGSSKFKVQSSKKEFKEKIIEKQKNKLSNSRFWFCFRFVIITIGCPPVAVSLYTAQKRSQAPQKKIMKGGTAYE